MKCAEKAKSVQKPVGMAFIRKFSLVLAAWWASGCAADVGYENPACGGNTVIVHLFEWRWTDVALECERFLAHAGYCGVQVSPPNEHLTNPPEYPYPWWQRYQPVSYELVSRSGSEDEFVDMVHRCNAVGVRIFTDVNHMAALGNEGVASAGSFDGAALAFPGVPFAPKDFTRLGLCSSDDGRLTEVRSCQKEANGLADLPHASQPEWSAPERAIIDIQHNQRGHNWPAEGKPVPSQASSSNRTVIFMHYETTPEQDVFIRGGIDAEHRPGCTDDAQTDACAVAIVTHMLGTIDTYDKYNSWRVGDRHLDWHGAEEGQATYYGQEALGTPLAWTTNNPLSPAYQELNTFGDHYWMVDTEMDCAHAEDGWVEVKAYVSNSDWGWEPDLVQETCSGSGGGSPPPYTDKNHFARCGYINVFHFGVAECSISEFPY
ncbi:uncharacterized protein LOC122242943 [Penaeus japonicus]|uniref:uncharacterized protein LOC122242943 n=1 Tax=Penaeus japonicus TaxID=27405 RepID=UPI001C712517|nr:uncharacterized protein LOC122242943 [Penaeus japonicus]